MFLWRCQSLGQTMHRVPSLGILSLLLMKRISILLCSEEEAAHTFTFLRGKRSCKVLMRARVAAGYLFGLLNTTEAFLMVQHLHIQSRKAATGWVLAQQHAALKQLPAESKYCKRDSFPKAPILL